MPAPSYYKTIEIKSLDDSIKMMREAVVLGLKDPTTRELAACVTRDAPGRDDMAEVRAIFDFIQSHVKYMADPRLFDTFSTLEHTLRMGIGDCFVRGQLVLKRGHQLVPVESLRVGDEIWGYDRWSRVEAVADKGTLPTCAIVLNNGSVVRLTKDHKVWVAVCPRHNNEKRGCKPCACAASECKLERVRVGDLQKWMALLQPARIPFGDGEQDPDRAWIEGLHAADGWHDPRAARFSISGQDGKSKEANKRLIEQLCVKWGIKTRWHRKYIAINDRDWAARVSAMGHKSWNKHLLTLNLNEGPALALLRGVLADSGANSSTGRTFTTTSRELFVQTRVLLKMAGLTASERFIVDHGGLGSHAIWRLGIRDSKTRQSKLLRIHEIIKDGQELSCVDVTTDDHAVWLPEADWTTSQCDDMAIADCTLLEAIGFETYFRVIQSKGSETWNHVYSLVRLPKRRPTSKLALDHTLANAAPGVQPSVNLIVKFKDYPVLTERMLR